MGKITERFLTGLFRVANYVASMCSPEKSEPTGDNLSIKRNRFSTEDLNHGDGSADPFYQSYSEA